MTSKQLREHAKDLRIRRVCFVCMEYIPEAAGVGNGCLGIMYHGGECSAVVSAEWKSFDRSARGRFLPRNEVLMAIAKRREESTP